METNKAIILIAILTIILIALGNMVGSYYFINRAFNLVIREAPPLTISNNQVAALKKIIKG